MTKPLAKNQLGRRDFLKITAAAAAVATIPAIAPRSARAQATTTAKRPNILFVFSDEHRWCSLPFTEAPHVIAPNMTRLAQQGARFDNCCSTNPICTPYRAMLLTGQWCHQSGGISNDYFGPVIDGQRPTIAHTFKQAGYRTGYIGKWHLGEDTVFDSGFDTFKHWVYGDDHWNTKRRDVPAKDYEIYKGYNAIGMTDQAIDFMTQQAKSAQPFLLMLSINPPHFRWDDAPEQDVKLYPQDKLPFRPNVAADGRWKQGNDLRDYQHYHAHITAVDRELGRLMDSLKTLGLEDNTILIYTSDHGSSWGSNGVSSKANPFDEAIRVPFLIRWPLHIAANKIADHNLATYDLYPTLCGFAGIAPPAFCAGQDFSPVMLGKPGPDPASQFILVNNFQRNYFRTQLDPAGPNIMYPFRGVRTKRYTYVVYAQGDWLLYDNQKDPYQQKNLINDPAYADVKADLQKELKAHVAKAEDPFIPAEWKALSLPDRIATENRHYSILPFRTQWDKYKATALAPYLPGATADQQRQLQAAADRIFDEPFFGRYKAFHFEVNTDKRNSKRPLEDIRKELAVHEKKYAALLKTEAERILSQTH